MQHLRGVGGGGLINPSKSASESELSNRSINSLLFIVESEYMSSFLLLSVLECMSSFFLAQNRTFSKFIVSVENMSRILEEKKRSRLIFGIYMVFLYMVLLVVLPPSFNLL